ncbi:sulfite exporter TauE/SafE family protein [Nonomuraea sp. NPDC050227]|uniref:sulfite exporter TauE/SafE family protein n=1 Tax=Nonomuraea sp. NPDC050227 TaxID=3364360 RepID=UPI00379ECD40
MGLVRATPPAASVATGQLKGQKPGGRGSRERGSRRGLPVCPTVVLFVQHLPGGIARLSASALESSTGLIPALMTASLLAFALAWLSSVGGVGGGVLMLIALTALFGLQVALPTLTLTQLASNGGRVWFNRRAVQWRLIKWYALGAVPFALAGGLLLPYVPVEPLKRVLGAFLVVTVFWRRFQPVRAVPADKTFAAIGAGCGLVSALFGAAGPLAAPFFLVKGLIGGAYIGTEASASLVIHLTKIVAYGAGSLLSVHVLLLGLALTPAVVAGAWLGRRTVARMNAQALVLVIEAGIVVAAILLIAGI